MATPAGFDAAPPLNSMGGATAVPLGCVGVCCFGAGGRFCWLFWFGCWPGFSGISTGGKLFGLDGVCWESGAGCALCCVAGVVGVLCCAAAVRVLSACVEASCAISRGLVVTLTPIARTPAAALAKIRFISASERNLCYYRQLHCIGFDFFRNSFRRHFEGRGFDREARKFLHQLVETCELKQGRGFRG